MSIVSVALRTESGDEYLSLFTDIQSPSDFVSRLFEEYATELTYVYYVAVCTDDGTEGAMENALQEQIEHLQKEDV